MVWYLCIRMWHHRQCRWKLCLISYYLLLQYFHQKNRTSLIWAAKNSHTDIVILLLEAGANVNSKDIVRTRMLICTFICARVCVCVPDSYIILHYKWKVSFNFVILLYFSLLQYCHQLLYHNYVAFVLMIILTIPLRFLFLHIVPFFFYSFSGPSLQF